MSKHVEVKIPRAFLYSNNREWELAVVRNHQLCWWQIALASNLPFTVFCMRTLRRKLRLYTFYLDVAAKHVRIGIRCFPKEMLVVGFHRKKRGIYA